MPEKDTEFTNAVAELRDEVEQKIDDTLDSKLDDVQADTKEKIKKIQDTLDKYEEIGPRLDKLESRLNRPERGEKGSEEETEKKVFYSYLRDGPPSKSAHDRELKSWAADKPFAEEKATMLSADDTTGGYLRVPAPVANDIIKDQVEVSPMRALARTRQTSTNKWTERKRTGTPTTEWPNSETSGASESNSEYGKLEVPVHPQDAKVSISVTNLEDSAVDMEREIRSDVNEQMMFGEGVKFIRGTGTGEPEGILNAGFQSVDGQASGASFHREDLIRLSHDLKTGYFQNGTYIFNTTSLRDIRLLTDSNNQFIWQPGLQSGDPNRIDGRPYEIMQDMDDPDSTGNFPVGYGDWRQAYLVVDRVDMRFQRDPYSGDDWEVLFKFRMRVGGGARKKEAARLLELTA